jgi:hypothetical protein
VIIEKYGAQRGGCCSEEVRGPYGVCLWRNIRNGLGVFLQPFSMTYGAEKWP